MVGGSESGGGWVSGDSVDFGSDGGSVTPSVCSTGGDVLSLPGSRRALDISWGWLVGVVSQAEARAVMRMMTKRSVVKWLKRVLLFMVSSRTVVIYFTIR